MCGRNVDKAYLDNFLNSWNSATDGCQRSGLLGYLQVMENYGGTLGCDGCVIIEKNPSDVTIRQGYPQTKKQLYYREGDVDPKNQLTENYFDGSWWSNINWKNVVVRDQATIVKPSTIETKKVPIGNSGYSYLFVVDKECGDLPMPIYTTNGEGQDGYRLVNDEKLQNCPTCTSGKWVWK